MRIFELRIMQGYGARWSADGRTFRGFLEPQLEGNGVVVSFHVQVDSYVLCVFVHTSARAYAC